MRRTFCRLATLNHWFCAVFATTRLRISILQYFNFSIFVAYAATNCAPKGQLLLARGSALGMCDHPRNAPCRGNYLFNLVGLFMRKSPTMNPSKQGTEVTDSCFALKYAENEASVQPFEYQKSTILTKQKDSSCVAKAPFLHPESSAFGIPYTMFWEHKSATLGVQERCLGKTAQPLPVSKSRPTVNKS